MKPSFECQQKIPGAKVSGTGRLKVRPSITAVAPNKSVFCGKSAAVLFCLAVFITFATFSANAQSTITPTTSTIQFAGTPGQSSITAPTGAQVLYGASLSPVTNQPVRHLWVGDATAGLCRMDPDLDSPGPYAINPATCLNIDSVLTIASVSATPNSGSNPVTCNAPVPGLINTNLVICSIASLGGPKAAKPVTVMKVTVNMVAPNQTNLQVLPTGTVSFDGIDTSNPTSTLTIRVH